MDTSKRNKAWPFHSSKASELPDHLLMRIMVLLPVPTLFKVRAVCRLWNSLLQSAEFLQLYSNTQRERSEWWVVFANTMWGKWFNAFSPYLGTWFRFPLLEPSSLAWPALFMDVPGSRQLVASAGGLICSVVDHGHPQNEPNPFNLHAHTVHPTPLWSVHPLLIVSNVLTGAAKCLPPPNLGCNLDFISMFTNSTTNSYHVLLGNTTNCLKVYDSCSNSWKDLPSHRSMEAGPAQSIPNGDFFDYEVDKDMLLAYNIKASTWSNINVYIPSNAARWCCVIKCQGQILLVAELCSQSWGFGVWGLEIPSKGSLGSWLELATTHPTPGRYSKSFHGKCFLAGTLICITRVQPFIIYDLATGSWYRTPSHKIDGNLDGLFSFKPSLTALV